MFTSLAPNQAQRVPEPIPDSHRSSSSYFRKIGPRSTRPSAPCREPRVSHLTVARGLVSGDDGTSDGGPRLAAYGLGYLYGPAAFTWLAARYPRLSRFANLLERLFARWGVLLLVAAPARTLAVLAGAARSSVRSFLLAYSAGHALWSTLTYYVGDALSTWTARLTAFLSAHLWESTAVCVLLVLFQQAIARARRARAKPDELEQPLG
jgi:hypothetical protein